jgi:endonuclease/exonuclease/phosphatase family metal-dependent hydrolase
MKVNLLAFIALFSFHTKAASLKVMQYNIENLFDTVHDEGKEDWTYLPLPTKNTIPAFNEKCAALNTEFYRNECLNLDWNNGIVAKKIQNLARAIKSYDSSGQGPDVLVLEEIENKNVLNQLVTQGLAGLGYKTQILIEGEDKRGVDVAIISKYPYKSANRYPVILDGQTLKTRGILEVILNVNGKDIAVFANHWPSQANPTAQRLASAKLLASLVQKSTAEMAIALGDFNTVAGEASTVFAPIASMIDAEIEARKVNSQLHPGTHYFRGNWSSLDRIFIKISGKVSPDYNTFQIMNRDFLLYGKKPNRFNTTTGDGYSDHLPIGMIFNL